MTGPYEVLSKHLDEYGHIVPTSWSGMWDSNPRWYSAWKADAIAAMRIPLMQQQKLKESSFAATSSPIFTSVEACSVERGGRKGNRTPTFFISSKKNVNPFGHLLLVRIEGFEPSPHVSETRMLPLNTISWLWYQYSKWIKLLLHPTLMSLMGHSGPYNIYVLVGTTTYTWSEEADSNRHSVRPRHEC